MESVYEHPFLCCSVSLHMCYICYNIQKEADSDNTGLQLGRFEGRGPIDVKRHMKIF